MPFGYDYAYPVDVVFTGAVFSGIGAISGGGGETVLLSSYSAQPAAAVLDYLFKPSFGAALHILKIEMGGVLSQCQHLLHLKCSLTQDRTRLIKHNRRLLR